MAKKGNRKHVIMRSEETGHTYHTSKNKRNTPDRMEFKKYDPKLKQSVMYKEEK